MHRSLVRAHLEPDRSDAGKSLGSEVLWKGQPRTVLGQRVPPRAPRVVPGPRRGWRKGGLDPRQFLGLSQPGGVQRLKGRNLRVWTTACGCLATCQSAQHPAGALCGPPTRSQGFTSNEAELVHSAFSSRPRSLASTPGMRDSESMRAEEPACPLKKTTNGVGLSGHAPPAACATVAGPRLAVAEATTSWGSPRSYSPPLAASTAA